MQWKCTTSSFRQTPSIVKTQVFCLKNFKLVRPSAQAEFIIFFWNFTLVLLINAYESVCGNFVSFFCFVDIKFGFVKKNCWHCWKKQVVWYFGKCIKPVFSGFNWFFSHNFAGIIRETTHKNFPRKIKNFHFF